jgi:glycosyltransferase involved in cell wall biosynthesis
VIPASGKNSLIIIIPCFNEEAAVGSVVEDVRRVLPGVPVLVIDDCSQDSTPLVARLAGADVLTLPTHLGLGGCVQAGYKLAFELGYEYVIRVDGDGQHDAHDIPRMFRTLRETGYQMVIGSRYLDGAQEFTSATRGLGIRLFRLILRPILGKWVLDPTSGFVGVNREALGVFGRSFPLEYPEIETLVVLKRKAFQFVEIPAHVRPRRAGRSSITATKSVYYIVHVLLGVFVNILKYEGKRRTHGQTS